MRIRVVVIVLAALMTIAACGTRVPHPGLDASGRQTDNVNADATTGDDATVGDAAAGTDTAGGAAAGAAAGSSSGGATATRPGGAASGATGGAAGATAASGDPIIIGAVGTRSGIVGSALAKSFRGLNVWQRWVNANGGLAGRPVRIVQADDGGDPGKHAAAVRRLILEERAVAFINVAPLTFSAGVPFLEQHNIPAIGGDSAENGWFTSPNAFPISGQTYARAIPIARWAIANLPQRKAAIYYVNEAEAPRRLGESFRDAWQERGGQVVAFTGVSLAAPDFTGEVINARNAGADIIYLALEHAACNRFWDAARRQRFNPMWLSAACSVESIRAAKDLTTNNTFTGVSYRLAYGPSPAQQEIKRAVDRYDPSLEEDSAFLFTWLSGKLLEVALKGKTGKIGGPQIIEALHAVKNETLGGMIPTQSWPPGPHPEGRCGFVGKFTGEIVEPAVSDFVC
ncbi:MAG: branched-chain amino acid transport system substrate-binding protein [Actinomycetota bacterium]|jgi:branched-chain amino acid transport system substrate-binding protein